MLRQVLFTSTHTPGRSYQEHCSCCNFASNGTVYAPHLQLTTSLLIHCTVYDLVCVYTRCRKVFIRPGVTCLCEHVSLRLHRLGSLVAARMKSTKKLINDPKDAVTEYLEGYVSSVKPVQLLEGAPDVRLVLDGCRPLSDSILG